jgi:GT2 family glycosyltransferase
MMTADPLLSFIVLSYNYEQYIGQSIRSILDQTVQDFEVVVVDDASTDRSREVVAEFGDPRIRVLTNDRNLGGAASYNRAILAARGKWLVNLDADDWITPDKSAVQLDMLGRDHSLDIIGTHVEFVDTDGNPHPMREALEEYANHDLDLNLTDSWVGRNSLYRSSTMVRRAAHLRIGPDDPTMVRAPDYELWTRALRDGCRFAMLARPLTFYRVHSRNVTFADPRGTFLEVSYAMSRNLLPHAEDGALWPSFSRIFGWVADHEELPGLTPNERYRLIGSMLMQPGFADYGGFAAGLRADDHSTITDLGRRSLALLRTNPLLDRLGRANAETRNASVEVISLRALLESRDAEIRRIRAILDSGPMWPVRVLWRVGRRLVSQIPRNQ